MSGNYRCHCGGIMEIKSRIDQSTQQAESWYVCPFCHTQRRLKDVAQQGSDTEDRVLTQVC